MLCEDESIIGAVFVIEERRHGFVVRDDIPPEFAGRPDLNRRIGEALIDALADLHLVPPEDVSLGDLGRPEGYVERQLAGWSRRWHAAQGGEEAERSTAAMAPVLDWLGEHLPRSGAAALLHNDYRLDNCLLDSTDPGRIEAVLDWDMCTQGDPLADLGYVLNYWVEPGDPPEWREIAAMPTWREGFPSRVEAIRRYAARTGFDVGAVGWHQVFAAFKLAVIIQQIYIRFVRGQTQDQRFRHYYRRVLGLADKANGLVAAGRRMNIARTIADLRRQVAAWRGRGDRIGLVPTMGAIHAGHLALVHAAAGQNERVVASLFVNPKQFGPSEDFSSYPRDEAADLAAFEGAGVDLVFMPGVEEMYPPGFATNVRVAGVSEGLDGAFRPGHFEGVATVVCKLLLQCLPDAAYFGEKDYQQLLVVRRMARDLDIPVHIEGVPTVREADGLALSSRNVYLSAEERHTAPLLNRVLRDVAAEIAARPDGVAASLERGRTALDAGGFAVDYLDLRDAADLAPVNRLTAPSRLLVAARIGRTRLIDNIAVVPEITPRSET